MEIHSQKELGVAHQQADCEPSSLHLLNPSYRADFLQEIYISRATYLLNSLQQHSSFNSKF